MFYLASAQDVLDKGQLIAQEFGVDWPFLIAQAVNFVLVAFVIYRFGFKGILSTVKEREKQISDSLKHAEKIKLELEEAEKRDPKGLYKKARAGEIKNFTGIDDPYEAPTAPEIHLHTDMMTLAEEVESVINYLEAQGFLAPAIAGA